MLFDEDYHDGEVRAQELAGERDIALMNGGSVEDYIVAPAFRFLAQQRFLVLGAAGAEDACEATVLFGEPGFLSATEGGKHLAVTVDPRRDRRADPVLGALAPGLRVGSIAIDLATRRRLRINGHVHALEDERIVVEVDEAYPNCPKYIQKRVVEVDPDATASDARVASGGALGEEQRAIVRGADTFFVATVHPRGHADTSHRGGPPGFVAIGPDGVLRIPDYRGNSMFNTLGNIVTNPRAALVFWDFERGVLLHLAGDAALDIGAEDPKGTTGGTGRYWTFMPRRWRQQSIALPFRMRLLEASPFNPKPAK